MRENDVASTVHGMRSSFRSWCAETGVNREAAEMSLGHVTGSVERAYQRSDLLDTRREVMTAWSDYQVQVAQPHARGHCSHMKSYGRYLHADKLGRDPYDRKEPHLPTSTEGFVMVPPREVLRIKDVCEMLDVGTVTLWRWRKDGTFPKPLQLGPNTVAWPRSVIEQWLESRAPSNV